MLLLLLVVVETTDAEEEEVHTRSRGLRVRGAGSSPRPGTLASVLRFRMRSASCLSAGAPRLCSGSVSSLTHRELLLCC